MKNSSKSPDPSSQNSQPIITSGNLKISNDIQIGAKKGQQHAQNNQQQQPNAKQSSYYSQTPQGPNENNQLSNEGNSQPRLESQPSFGPKDMKGKFQTAQASISSQKGLNNTTQNSQTNLLDSVSDSKGYFKQTEGSSPEPSNPNTFTNRSAPMGQKQEATAIQNQTKAQAKVVLPNVVKAQAQPPQNQTQQQQPKINQPGPGGQNAQQLQTQKTHTFTFFDRLNGEDVLYENNDAENYDYNEESRPYEQKYDKQEDMIEKMLDSNDLESDDIVRRLFKSKEISFKGANMESDQKFLNTDRFIKDFELQSAFIDRDGRSMLHRAALDQNAQITRSTLANIKERENNERKGIQEKMAIKDKYGNTPLLLSCIMNYEDKRNQQKEVVQLIAQNIRPQSINDQNPQTQFTTLHWACINGREDIVEMLVKTYGAQIYITDKFGFYPIDYAGKFKHAGCVKHLVERLLLDVWSISGSKEVKTKKAAEARLAKLAECEIYFKDYVDNNLKAGLRYKEHTNPLLLYSPILHTTSLYWACMYDEIKQEQVQVMLRDLECYPELPILADKNRTPCHAAAQSGNKNKLHQLIEDIQKRYAGNNNINLQPQGMSNARVQPTSNSTIMQRREAIGGGQFQRDQPYRNQRDVEGGYNDQFYEEVYNWRKDIIDKFKPRFQLILKQPRYASLRKFYTTVFDPTHLQRKQQLEGTQIKFDFKDKGGNTPLHIAAQYGKDNCVSFLIDNEYCSQTIRNQEGWMPRDLQQHQKVQLAFETYIRKKERAIKFAKSELSQGLDAQARSPNASQPGSPSKRRETEIGIERLQVSSVDEPEFNMQKVVSQFIQNPSTDAAYKKTQLENELILCKKYLPNIPPVVLKVSIEKQFSRDIINGMVDVLKNQGFQVSMFQSVVENHYYVTLKLKQDKYEEEAKKMKLKVKLCDVDSKQPFEPNQKVKFEPFRSKDQQKIIVTMLKNIISPDTLKDQGILLQILPMHDLSNIHEIREKWQHNRSYYPQPIFIISQFYKQGPKYDYNELSTIKNYFGESTGFYYAWMSFYTSWILIPAGLGFALTVYQILFKVDNIFTSLYSLCVCLWVTFFLELWRRKSSEIALKWGVLEDNSDLEKEVRPEFNGDENFSNINYKVSKKNVTSKLYLYLFLSIPIFVVLIGICVGVYFATRQLKNSQLTGDSNMDSFIQTAAGIINGVAIAIVNFIYQKLAVIFMRLENHKFQDTYAKSFIFKLFAFKFINTNISLFYTAFIDQNFDSLYYLIVGMTIQKAVQIFGMKIVKKYIMFWYYKRRYFKRIERKAKEQSVKHASFLKKLQDQDRFKHEALQNDLNKFKDIHLYKDLFQRAQNDKREMENVFYRLVFNVDQERALGKDLVLTDYVEINSLMTEMFEIDSINEQSEVFIMFGLATLYACACPIVAFIVMIHNLIDINWDLWTRYTCIRRPIATVSTNIGPWLKLVEFMAIFAVITNCLLLYFSSPTLRLWLEDTFGVTTEVLMLWILVFLEHIILFVKICGQVLIPDKPVWVSKSQTKVNSEVEQIRIEETERDENMIIVQSKEIIRSLIAKYKFVLEGLKQLKDNEALKYKQRGQMDQQTIQKLKKENEQLKGVAIARQIEDERNQQRLKQEKLGLVDFLDIYPSEWFGNERRVELEKRLCFNISKRLMSLTFNRLEKEILQRRISKLYITKQTLQINCAQCNAAEATLECLNCQDHFCQLCSNEMHHPSNQVLAMHSVILLPRIGASSLASGKPLFSLLAPVSEQTAANSQNIPKSISFRPQWKKFEYFNFALDPANDLYFQIQRQYIYLRQQYIETNFIEQGDKLDFQGLFVDRQYDLLLENQAQRLKQKDIKRGFGTDTMIVSQGDRFNDEEHFYMNRIAYFLFKIKSERLTFANFVVRLNLLQYGQYERRLTLWLSLLDEVGDELITKEQFEQFLLSIYVQDTTNQMSISQIVNSIFTPDAIISVEEPKIEVKAYQVEDKEKKKKGPISELEKMNSTQAEGGLRNSRFIETMHLNAQKQVMTYNKLIQKLSVDSPARELMECVLQYDIKEVRDKL